jgi:hypothetical protein
MSKSGDASTLLAGVIELARCSPKSKPARRNQRGYKLPMLAKTAAANYSASALVGAANRS